LLKTKLNNNTNQTCVNNNNNNNANCRSENQYSRGGAATSKTTTKINYNSNNELSTNKTLNRKNSHPLPILQTKQKPAAIGIKDSKANESAEYVVYQNPHHNVLPDYHQVLKNNSTKHAANGLKNENINNNNHNRKAKQEDEENIFNIGKAAAPAKGGLYERENLRNTHACSDEENFENENNEGKK